MSNGVVIEDDEIGGMPAVVLMASRISGRSVLVAIHV